MNTATLTRLGIVAAAFTVASACGSTSELRPEETPTAEASVAPLASPPSASPSANPSLFNTGDCTLAPVAGTTTGPLPDNFKVVVTIPESWTPTNGARSETLLLLLNAPASYSNQPTQIGLHSLLGYFATQTPEELAKGFYGPSTHATVPSVELIGDVRHCNVQGDQGAFFEYAQGDRHGYLVLFLHEHYLYGLRVEGKDGLDPSAVRDAKRVLGSWHWTVTSPPPH